MTENQRFLWVLSMPVCASINETMHTFSCVSYETSDQHKDVSASRQARDVSDTVDLIDYLNERGPFGQNDSLFNIANGMTVQERVNVEKAREIGVKIVEFMSGKSTDEFTFRKANQTVTSGSRSTRTGDCVGVTVHFASGMMIKSKKDEFLNNNANKQRFIHCLNDNLERESWMQCRSCKIWCRRSHRADSCRVCQAQRYCTDWRRHRFAGPSTTPCRNWCRWGIPEIRAQEIHTTEKYGA